MTNAEDIAPLIVVSDAAKVSSDPPAMRLPIGEGAASSPSTAAVLGPLDCASFNRNDGRTYNISGIDGARSFR